MATTPHSQNASTSKSSSRVRRNVHAEAVLPATLIRQLQAHVSACYVWVPSRLTMRSRQRRREVLRLRAEGRRVADIAAEIGVTERRVYQILRRERERATFSVDLG